MQPMSIPPKAGKVAFQQGLIFGLIQAGVASVILLSNAFINNAPGALGSALLLGVASFLLSLAAYFLAGMRAAKQTGKVSTGTFAGMWTGGIYGIIGFVVSMVIFFQISLPRLLDTMGANSPNPDAFRVGAMIGGVGGAIFGILFAIGLGAGLGALGGLVGKKTSKIQPVVAVPVYPGYPYQDQPMPYAQPMPYMQPMAPAQPASYEQSYVQANPYAQPMAPAQQVNADQPYMEQPQ